MLGATALLLDAHQLDEGAHLSADVCIMGAGAAGITLALELIDSGLEVCVLAGGGMEVREEEQALYQGIMSGIDTWDPQNRRARAFGGSTHLWAGWCRPLEPEDFRERDYIPHSGWPLAFDDLVPYYRRAHSTLELGVFDYDARQLAERNGRPLLPLQDGAVRTEFYQFSPPTRMHERYGRTLEEATNVRIYLHAHVVDVVARPGERVGRVSCRTLEGKRFEVEAERYVLALGGIENARILLASNDGRGAANESDLVGRYFMEHPHYYHSAAVVLPREVDASFYHRFDANTQPDPREPSVHVPVMGVLALSADVREREELPSCLVQVNSQDVVDADEAARTGPLGPLTTAELLDRRDEPGFFSLTIRVEQTPNAESYIGLSEERDALGLPVVDVHWKIRRDDHRTLARSLELLGAELAIAGLGRLWMPVEGKAFSSTPAGACHHMGTTRMGTDPAWSVVDANCRSHELPNLYIAGSSVFPTGGSANPTLTIVALAHRLADHLKETM